MTSSSAGTHPAPATLGQLRGSGYESRGVAEELRHNLLKRLRTERGLTYILVSHNLSVVAYMCDRLAVMNRGRVVEEMSVADLRRGEAAQDYTRQLLRASQGYDRAAADSFRDFA